MKLQLHAAVEQEVLADARWYELRAEGIGVAFLDAVRRAYQAIAKHPESYPIHAHSPPGRTLQFYALRRFPYEVVFEHRATQLVVVAVANAKRKPGYWLRRLG